MRRSSVRVREPQKSNPIPTPVREMEPKRYEQPPELPKILTEGQDVVSKLDRMLEDEENARKRGRCVCTNSFCLEKNNFGNSQT